MSPYLLQANLGIMICSTCFRVNRCDNCWFGYGGSLAYLKLHFLDLITLFRILQHDSVDFPYLSSFLLMGCDVLHEADAPFASWNTIMTTYCGYSLTADILSM